jgi:hypothetical protein
LKAAEVEIDFVGDARVQQCKWGKNSLKNFAATGSKIPRDFIPSPSGARQGTPERPRKEISLRATCERAGSRDSLPVTEFRHITNHYLPLFFEIAIDKERCKDFNAAYVRIAIILLHVSVHRRS